MKARSLDSILLDSTSVNSLTSDLKPKSSYGSTYTDSLEKYGTETIPSPRIDSKGVIYDMATAAIKIGVAAVSLPMFIVLLAYGTSHVITEQLDITTVCFCNFHQWLRNHGFWWLGMATPAGALSAAITSKEALK